MPVRPATARLNSVLDKSLHKITPPAKSAPGVKKAETNSPSPAVPVVQRNMSPVELKDILEGKFDQNYIYDVPIDWIDGSDKALTYNREEAEEEVDLSDLEEDMQQNGQIEPGFVRVNGASLLQIEQGWRRYLTAKKIGLKTYRCVITKDDNFQAAIKSISLNLNRKDIPDFQKIMKIKQFSEQFGKSYEEIGVATGFGKKSNISQMMQLVKFPLVLEALHEKKISTFQGNKICQKIKKEGLDEAKTQKLINLVHNKSVSSNDLAYLDLDKATGTKDKAASKEILKQKKDGGFSLSYKYEPATSNLKELDKAVAAIEEALGVLKKDVKERRG